MSFDKLLIGALLAAVLPSVLAQQPTPATAQQPANNGATVPSVQQRQSQQAQLPQQGQIQPGAQGAVPLVPIMPTRTSQYENAKATVYPITPEQVREWQEAVSDQKRAARAKIKTVPITSSATIDLSPGSAPPAVRVAPFFGATINFIDMSGNPWPIKSITNFNKDDFQADAPFKGSNTLTVSNLGSYGQSSVTVFLDQLDTPIVMVVYGGQKETDARLDLRVPRRKPGTIDVVPASNQMQAANLDRRLIELLDGIVPAGSVSLKTSDAIIRAWQLDDKLIIRTSASVMINFDQRVPSQDGTSVYSMPMTPLVYISVDGVPRSVSIEF